MDDAGVEVGVGKFVGWNSRDRRARRLGGDVCTHREWKIEGGVAREDKRECIGPIVKRLSLLTTQARAEKAGEDRLPTPQAIGRDKPKAWVSVEAQNAGEAEGGSRVGRTIDEQGLRILSKASKPTPASSGRGSFRGSRGRASRWSCASRLGVRRPRRRPSVPPGAGGCGGDRPRESGRKRTQLRLKRTRVLKMKQAKKQSANSKNLEPPRSVLPSFNKSITTELANINPTPP